MVVHVQFVVDSVYTVQLKEHVVSGIFLVEVYNRRLCFLKATVLIDVNATNLMITYNINDD